MPAGLTLLRTCLALSLAVKPVVIRGTAWDCEGEPSRAKGVRVLAFDAGRNSRMLSLLRLMERDASTAQEAMTVFFARYDSVDRLAKRNHALARTVADTAGHFRLSFSPVDSILIYAYDEMEDEPVYYTCLVMGGRSSKSIALKFYGSCSVVRSAPTSQVADVPELLKRER